MKVVIACLAFVCGSALAAGVTDEQAAYLYAVAYGQYHFLPDFPPTVRTLPHAELCALNHFPVDCPIFGLYEDGQIYLSDRLDFSVPKDASVLLHEYIHYFQECRDGPILAIEPSKRCAAVMQREHEAYEIQSEVLRKSNEQFAALEVMMAARSIRCYSPRDD